MRKPGQLYAPQASEQTQRRSDRIRTVAELKRDDSSSELTSERFCHKPFKPLDKCGNAETEAGRVGTEPNRDDKVACQIKGHLLATLPPLKPLIGYGKDATNAELGPN